MAEVNDEQRLIHRVVARHPAAEDEFVDRYRGFVLGLARGRLQADGDTADELWHETLAKLWQDDHKALKAWRGQGRFTTYLTVIVTHLAWRRRRRRQPEDGLHELTREPVVEDPAADDVLMRQQAQRAVRRAITTLSPRDRLLIALRFNDERTPKDIAVLLGQAPGTVRKALHDALKRLRLRLTEGSDATATGIDGAPRPEDDPCLDPDPDPGRTPP